MDEKEGPGTQVKNSRLLSKTGGASHSIWINPKNGTIETVPRHNEIKEPLAKKILKNMGAL